MGGYLIPANANRGKLILGFFRMVDLIIFGIGAFITLMCLFIFQNSMDNTAIAVAVLLPIALSTLLVMPVPNQHNVLVLLGAIYNFYFVNRQKFVWKGWTDKYGDE